MKRGDVIVGKYRLVRQLGAGGMGVVWEAVHLVTGRPFAIKFLLAPGRGEHHERFAQEARVSGIVRHPNIVDVYDVGSAPELADAPFLVMELLDGVTLGEMLESAGRLSIRQTLAIAIPLVSALAEAHGKGVVHRDLKPSNLFLTRQATGAVVPKVLDFGISKLVGSARKSESDADARRRLTRTGAVLGSPLYMSPEQLRGDTTLDARSDIHAIGAILWECLAGQSLFSAKLDDAELAGQIMNGTRRSLVDVWPECPPELSRTVDRCVAVRREERFASAGEVFDELVRLEAELSPGSSLTDPKQALELFPLLTAPKVPKALEHATTVDSDGLASRTMLSPGSPSSPKSVSVAAWADKRNDTGAKPSSRALRPVAYAAVAIGLIVAAGALRQRIIGGPSTSAASTSLATTNGTVRSGAQYSDVHEDGRSPPAVTATTTATTTATPTPTPPAVTATHRAKAPAPKVDAGAAHEASTPETIGTSANGAPIVR